jgi:hypothetical protein
MKRYISLSLALILVVILFLTNSSASFVPDVCPPGTFEPTTDCECECQGSGQNQCCTCSCGGGSCSTAGARCGAVNDDCSWGKLKKIFSFRG